MTAAIDRVSTVLGDLAFAGAEFIYCHASLKDLGLSVDDARALVDRIRWANRGPCTLVIPSFPFGENVEYAAYVSRPELDSRASEPLRRDLPAPSGGAAIAPSNHDRLRGRTEGG